MESVKGKVALVTGAVQGIGFGVAKLLLQNGAKVCLVDVNAEKGIDVVQRLQKDFGQDSAIFVKCDVTCEADLNSAFQKTTESFGGLDILCNNAGIFNESEWKKMVDINLTAVIHGTMLGVQYMGTDKGGKGGVVINTASMAGIVDEDPMAPVYVGTKHAVVAFTRSMGANKWFTDKGLRINCICPSFVDTDLMKVTDKHVYGGQATVNEFVEKNGSPLPVSKVAEAFMQVIRDTSLNGAAMLVLNSGTELAETKQPIE